MQLTDHASDAIRNLLAHPALPESAGLRIVRHDSEGAGFSLFYAESPHEGDEVIDRGGARVLVAAGATNALDGKVLDAEILDGGQVRFKVAAT
jgi:Fe-S cluster assembly iron-binding protein IscA